MHRALPALASRPLGLKAHATWHEVDFEITSDCVLESLPLTAVRLEYSPTAHLFGKERLYIIFYLILMG